MVELTGKQKDDHRKIWSETIYFLKTAHPEVTLHDAKRMAVAKLDIDNKYIYDCVLCDTTNSCAECPLGRLAVGEYSNCTPFHGYGRFEDMCRIKRAEYILHCID